MWEGNEVVVVPRFRNAGCPEASPQARQRSFCLPYIPSSAIEVIAGISRCFWRRCQRSLTHLLFLNPGLKTWQACLPPQFAAPDDGRWNPSFGGCTGPSPHLLLAGSVRSLPHHDAADLILRVPLFDGVHLVTHPSRDWVSLTCSLRIGGALYDATCDQVLVDDCETLLDPLLERIWCADRL